MGKSQMSSSNFLLVLMSLTRESAWHVTGYSFWTHLVKTFKHFLLSGIFCLNSKTLLLVFVFSS